MEEKGLELRDYIKVILKRKKIILTIFFVAVFAATIVSFLMPRLYETSIVIKNGYVEEPIIKYEEVKEIITSSKILSQVIARAGIEIEVSGLRNILRIEDIKGTRSFKVTVQYSDPQKTKEIAEIIGKIYVREGQKLYQKRINSVKKDLESVETTMKNTTKTIARIENSKNNNEDLINNIENSITKELETLDKVPRARRSYRKVEGHFSDLKVYISMLVSLDNYYLNNLTQLSNRNLNLLNKKENIESILTKAEEFKILSSPSLPEFPVKPNKKLNISISALVGLFLGIFLVFLQEYLSKTE